MSIVAFPVEGMKDPLLPHPSTLTQKVKYSKLVMVSGISWLLCTPVKFLNSLLIMFWYSGVISKTDKPPSIGFSACETLLFVKQMILRESLTVVELDYRALEHELSVHPQLHRVTVVYLHQRHLVAVLL